jgi:N-acetylglutamate synthase-like GNAT family acetyltransferase
MKGQRLFVRPIEAADHDAIAAFLHEQEGAEAVPACGLLGKLVGDVVAVVALELTPDALRVDDIVVAGTLRRKRIGRGMLREVEQLAVKMERSAVLVDDARGAQEFFRRVGFENEGDRWVRWVG